MKGKELYSGLIRLHVHERPENDLPRRPVARDLMKSLVIELRASAGEVKAPEAQALLETSAAAPGGLIKAFGDYERRSEIKQ